VVIAVIDYQTDRQSLVNLGATQRGAYVANAPFSHIVIDEFFDADAMNAALAEIDAVERPITTSLRFSLKWSAPIRHDWPSV
jgi:hypothetical protein